MAGISASPVHPVTSAAAAAAGPDNTTPRVVLHGPSESVAQTLSAALAKPQVWRAIVALAGMVLWR